MRENIEKERKLMHLNKRELCDAVGITTRTYWNYLAGGPIPSDKLVKLARLFGCSTDYLLDLTNKRTASP